MGRRCPCLLASLLAAGFVQVGGDVGGLKSVACGVRGWGALRLGGGGALLNHLDLERRVWGSEASSEAEDSEEDSADLTIDSDRADDMLLDLAGRLAAPDEDQARDPVLRGEEMWPSFKHVPGLGELQGELERRMRRLRFEEEEREAQEAERERLRRAAEVRRHSVIQKREALAKSTKAAKRELRRAGLEKKRKAAHKVKMGIKSRPQLPRSARDDKSKW